MRIHESRPRPSRSGWLRRYSPLSSKFLRSTTTQPFLILALTGLREQELCWLTWEDLCLEAGREHLLVRAKPGFSPKDYEQREVPIPAELARLLRALPRRSEWVFPNRRGEREGHLLRRLRAVARRAGVERATLHKFRHTYATRLLEQA